MLSQREIERLRSLTQIENQLRSRGYVHIAGVDEAGRGPLAGPVVAAACILPCDLLLPGINDSKKLSAAQRAELFEVLTTHPDILYGIGIVDHTLIDQINILQATLKAMQRALDALSRLPDFVLVDGNRLPPALSMPGEALVKGDSRSQSIAAASILAKETRDALMDSYHEQWPVYHFLENRGYGTKDHLEALEKHGPCPIHRMTFKPLRDSVLSHI